MESEELKKENQWPPDRVFASKSIEEYVKEAKKINHRDWSNQIYNNPKIKIEMKEQIAKTESVQIKRFTVVVLGKEVFKGNDRKEVAAQIFKLQKDSQPLIILLDSEVKESYQYSKTIHQRNYRVQAGNYEEDSVLKPAPEVTKTEE
jgi:hypothetical protein